MRATHFACILAAATAFIVVAATAYLGTLLPKRTGLPAGVSAGNAIQESTIKTKEEPVIKAASAIAPVEEAAITTRAEAPIKVTGELPSAERLASAGRLASAERLATPEHLATPEPSASPEHLASAEHLASLTPPEIKVEAPAALAVLPLDDRPPALTHVKDDLSYLTYYAYSEVPPEQKPADTVLVSLKDVPLGTPIEEIRRATDAFGLDFTFMKAVAKIESGFDPTQRTGMYIGLFQLSNYEFAKYGSGDIMNARDNAIAAAYKFTTAAILFELSTHKKATMSDLYLIHQQGTQGAEKHVNYPDQIAWKSMCDTDEGREKGEKWCKRAIWRNTLPAIKQVWKSVDNLTSGAFVAMWRQRVNELYASYSAKPAN